VFGESSGGEVLALMVFVRAFLVVAMHHFWALFRSQGHPYIQRQLVFSRKSQIFSALMENH